jgi:hypothetical protein
VKGEVRETAATSSDDGKTWKPWFDLAFRPRTSSMSTTPSSAADDTRIIAALDTQYQAAAKDSDAATMNQILADDFILVTGSGKTYTKADLPAEARSGRVHSERQDDKNQTVRVWGDTAVISEDLGQNNSEDCRESPSANNSAGDAVKTSDSIRLTPASTRVKTAHKRHLANCDPAFGDEHGGSD